MVGLPLHASVAFMRWRGAADVTEIGSGCGVADQSPAATDPPPVVRRWAGGRVRGGHGGPRALVGQFYPRSRPAVLGRRVCLPITGGGKRAVEFVPADRS